MIPAAANPLLMKTAADDEVVTKSCRFDDGTKTCLTRTHGATDNETWTWAGWVKRGKLGAEQSLFSAGDSSGYTTNFTFQADDTLYLDIDIAGTSDYTVVTDAVYRDVGAWYHCCLVYDMTESLDTDRIRIYVNGEKQTLTEVDSGYPAAAYTGGHVNTAVEHAIGGRKTPYDTAYFGGYMADVYFIDGSAVEPKGNFTNDPASDTKGQLKPIAYDMSSHSDNSFHLEFLQDGVGTGDSDTIGADTSGEDNHFDSTALVASDQVNDRPTNNYAVWNPLSLGSGGTLTEGNLALATSSSGYANCYSTIAMGESNDTQKYYAEFYVTDAALAIIGMATLAAYDTSHVGNNNESWGYYQDGSLRWGTWATPGSNDAYSDGEIIGVMYDAGANTITFYNEGDEQTYGFSSTQNLDTKKPLVFAMSDASGSGTAVTAIANYGQDPTFAGNKTSGQDESQSEFYYAPPTGAVALSTANLPDPPIAKGNEHFDAVLYTGNGGTQTVTFPAVETDLVWIKSRDIVADGAIYDTVRTAEQRLEVANSGAEVTKTNGLTAFNEKEFSLGDLAGSNQDTKEYVAWNWKESAEAGMDIVTWTGNSTSTGVEQTVPHSLDAAPDFAIFKAREDDGTGNAQNWYVYHKNVPANKYVMLDTTDAETDHDPTNSLWVPGNWDDETIEVGNDDYVLYLNYDDTDYVGYLFNEVAGYSKFGSYIGNNDNDGPFVWCGFKPRWIMIKAISAAPGEIGYPWVGWVIIDTARSPYNIERSLLLANSSAVEDTTANADVDILSNGFKPRYTPNETNGNNTYIFAAFAEQPFKYAAAR